MNINFLPTKIVKAIDSVDFDALKEIRFRLGYPIILNFGLRTCYLSEFGSTLLSEKGITCDISMINEIISNVTERSIYSHNEKIKQGYLISSDGVRVGLAGECVIDNGQVVTVKNITSLNVRLSRMVRGCAKDIIKYLINDNKVENTLIVSPAGLGKTTMLKDIAIYIDKLNIGSLLIIDERGEFQSVSGINIDKIQYSDKLYSFTFGIRSMW